MKKFEWLEAMRGFAAVWVLLHHAALAARDFAGLLASEWQLLHNGYLGVDFFFVLSGFIIAVASQRLVEGGRGLRDYATARTIRIYVPYLPVGLAILALYALLPNVSAGQRTDISVLTSVTLLPSNAPPALSVAWTLVHEILFYALFSLYFISRRALLVTMAVWTMAIVTAWAAGSPIGRFGSYFLSPLNLCFVVGVLVAWGSRRGVSNWLGGTLGLAGAALVASQAVLPDPNRVLVAVGFAALVAASRAPLPMAVAPGRTLLLMGAASYAVYLVHNPAISALVRLTKALPHPVMVLATISIGALAIGVAFHLLYERPALQWVRRRLTARAQVVVTT